MSIEKRQFERIELPARVKMNHPDLGEVILKIRDLSDGGIYVLCDSCSHLAVGSDVTIQVIHEDAETPVVSMKIMRHDSNGMGMMFI